MNYYHHMLDSKVRQQDAARERNRQALMAEARLANQVNHRPRIKLSFRLRLPRRNPPQPCPTCPEFAGETV